MRELTYDIHRLRMVLFGQLIVWCVPLLSTHPTHT